MKKEREERERQREIKVPSAKNPELSIVPSIRPVRQDIARNMPSTVIRLHFILISFQHIMTYDRNIESDFQYS